MRANAYHCHVKKDSCENEPPRFVRGITPRGFHRRFVDVLSATRVTTMISTNSLRSLVALLCAVCFLTAANVDTAWGQTSTATLTGIVQDSTGAVLPNVTVSATNTDRNTTQFTRTNETGGYVLAALNPGNYSISAELAGFRRFAREGVVIQVNQVARIDIRLDLGSVEETRRSQGRSAVARN